MYQYPFPKGGGRQIFYDYNVVEILVLQNLLQMNTMLNSIIIISVPLKNITFHFCHILDFIVWCIIILKASVIRYYIQICNT